MKKLIIILFLLLMISGCCFLKGGVKTVYYDSMIQGCCDSCTACTECVDIRGIK